MESAASQRKVGCVWKEEKGVNMKETELDFPTKRKSYTLLLKGTGLIKHLGRPLGGEGKGVWFRLENLGILSVVLVADMWRKWGRSSLEMLGGVKCRYAWRT